MNETVRKAGWRILLASLLLGLLPVFVASAQTSEGDPDDDLLKAVEADFAAYDIIPANDLDVSVDVGVVTLSGSVDTLLVKQRAVLLVERLKGVRAIVNLIDVQPDKRTDRQIRDDAKAVLRDDPVADSEELRIQVDDGVVTLTGKVDSYAEAQFAGTALMGVRGVRDLRNEIQVIAKQDRPDEEIRPEIERRFASDPWLADGLMGVEVDDGRVTLSGLVGSLREKRIANMLAWVAGVRSVDDSGLDVRWWLRREMWRGDKTAVRSDTQITRAVKDALLYDPRLHGANVKVRCRLGYVTLLGGVASLGAKRAAEQDAKNTLGVNRVTNRLVVVSAEDRVSGPAISERLQAAIRRDAHLVDVDVFGTSRGGKVYLDGIVDSKFQKERAGVIAANLPGVIEVVNRLEIDRPKIDRSDDEIQQEVERHLETSALLDSSRIAVEVEDGTATLRGVIDTFQQYSIIENMTLRAGASRVNNELIVRSSRRVIDGLVAELIAERDVYELAPERSGKAFRDLLLSAKRLSPKPEQLPPPPTVDLVLRLHNEGTEPVEIRVGHDLTEIELGLTGKGAIHVPLRRSFAATFRPGRVVEISPGEDYEIPINSLQYGFRNASERWYWTQTGDYRLQATFAWPAGITGLQQYAVTTGPAALTVVEKVESAEP